MREFHNAYYPRMVESLGRAMRVFAGRRFPSGRATQDAGGVGDVIHGRRIEVAGVS
jgi:hypothetical protein